jgi:hypothetical protein
MRVAKQVKLTDGVRADMDKVRQFLLYSPGQCARIIGENTGIGYSRALVAVRAIHQNDAKTLYTPLGYSLQGRQRHHYIIKS